MRFFDWESHLKLCGANLWPELIVRTIHWRANNMDHCVTECFSQWNVKPSQSQLGRLSACGNFYIISSWNSCNSWSVGLKSSADWLSWDCLQWMQSVKRSNLKPGLQNEKIKATPRADFFRAFRSSVTFATILPDHASRVCVILAQLSSFSELLFRLTAINSMSVPYEHNEMTVLIRNLDSKRVVAEGTENFVMVHWLSIAVLWYSTQGLTWIE